MIEDKATEELKKRAQDSGLIVNAGADEQRDTIESQTNATRPLPRWLQAERRGRDGKQEGRRRK
jgi:hypothetical protein